MLSPRPAHIRIVLLAGVLLAALALLAFANGRAQFDESLVFVDRPLDAGGVPYFWAWGLAYAVFWVGAWCLAALVYLARPDRLQNRLLALLLAIEGLFWLQVALTNFQEILGLGPRDVWAIRIAGRSTFHPLMAAYLAFLGTLDTPISRLLGTPTARRLLLAGGILGAAAYAIAPTSLVRGVVWIDFGGAGRWEAVPWTTLEYVAQVALFLAVWLFALVVAIIWFVRAPRGSKLRNQAGAYLGAFGARDAGLIVSWVGATLFTQGLLGGSAHGWGPVYPVYIVMTAEIIGATVLLVLLPYGLLRYQLFETDLAFKWTLRRGTVAAGMAVVFFVAKEGVEAVLPVEGVVPSIAAAAVVAAVAVPVWRVSGRLTDRLLPHVQNTDEYRTVRKRELYEAAVESAMKDGVITQREREVLATLMQRLALKAAEARRIERDVRGRMAGAG